MQDQPMKNKPLFAHINEVPCQYPWLSIDEECDVLVIGGGITGAFCLYHLVKSGFDAVMVTQKPVGYASTCVNNSILQATNEVMLTELSKTIGKDLAIAYYRECGVALDEIEELSKTLDNFDFMRRDGFVYATSPDKANCLHTEYLMRRHNGFEVDFLEKSDARELFSFDIQAGILAKNQAGEADGYQLCHALINQAQKDGARVYENTTVECIENETAGIVVETAFGKKIKARKIVMAIGLLAEEYLNKDISRKSSFTIATEPVKNFPGYQTRAIVRNLDTNVFLRTTKDNRILMGGLDCSLMNRTNPLAKMVGVDRLIDRKYRELETIMNHMLIAIDDLKVEYQYHGQYPYTNDLLPIAEEYDDYQDIVFALPTSINGILSAQMIAKKITLKLNEDLEV